VQFDRVNYNFDSHIIVNDNKDASYKAVKHLVEQGYKKIAFLGGPEYLASYKERKEGYLMAIEEAGLDIPYNYLVDNILKTDTAFDKTMQMMGHKNPPDAFFTVSDHTALGVLKASHSLGLKAPHHIGIMGFANEAFTEVTSPTLSTIEQQSKKLGKEASDIYFNHILKSKEEDEAANFTRMVIKSSLIVRESSLRKKQAKANDKLKIKSTTA
jgi:LacI family transcriptional regulator